MELIWYSNKFNVFILQAINGDLSLFSWDTPAHLQIIEETGNFLVDPVRDSEILYIGIL